MKLTFLGTSHGKPEKNRYHTSTLLTVKGKHYLIDAGAPVFDLFERSGLQFCDVRGVFITHSHIDHIAGLPVMTAALNSRLRFFDVAFPVLVPELEPYLAMFEFWRGKRELCGRLCYEKYQDGVIFSDENVKITAIPTLHHQSSHAFLIEAEGKRILITGDLKKDLSDYPAEITEGTGLDLVVTEAAHQIYAEPYVGETLAKSKTARMIIHHVAEHRNPLSTIEQTLAALPFPAEIAYDGMVIEL